MASGQRGFSLVELMVTVAVLVIVGAIAIPNFTSIINRNRIVSQANELVAIMQGARSEAIRRNARVYVCASANGSSCSGTDAWTGWLTFQDANGNASPDAGEIIQTGLFNAAVQVASSSAQITGGKFHFRADGLARGKTNSLLATSFRVCAPVSRPADNIRNVQIVSGSRFQIAKANGNGAC